MGTCGLWRGSAKSSQIASLVPEKGYIISAVRPTSSRRVDRCDETIETDAVTGVGVCGALGPFVAGFAAELSRQGYNRSRSASRSGCRRR